MSLAPPDGVGEGDHARAGDPESRSRDPHAETGGAFLRVYCGESVEVPGIPEGTPIIEVGGDCPLTGYGDPHDAEHCKVTAIDYAKWQFTCEMEDVDGPHRVPVVRTQPLPDAFAQVRTSVRVDAASIFRKPEGV